MINMRSENSDLKIIPSMYIGYRTLQRVCFVSAKHDLRMAVVKESFLVMLCKWASRSRVHDMNQSDSSDNFGLVRL